MTMALSFFLPHGTKLPDALEIAIEEQLEKEMTTVDSAELGKAIRIVDAPGRYIEFCKSTVSSDITLNGLKLIIDCANGAAYHIAPNVFLEFGAEVIEIGVEPNGLNINLKCGATYPDVLREHVLREKADLGIGLDGDGDRVIMLDHRGEVLDGDELLYIISKHRQESGMLKGGVVGTVMSNLGLELAIQKMGLEFSRVPVGDRYIMAELMQRKWHLGGEPSGHIICSDAITTGDGIVTALQVLSAMRFKQQSLHELKRGLQKCPQILINVKAAVDQNPCEIPRIKKAVQEAEAILKNNGRILLRRSGTESVVRVMVEGQDQSVITQIANQLAEVVRQVLG